MRSLQAFEAETLREEARDGQGIADALVARFGAALITRSDLGPMIDEQDVLALLGPPDRRNGDRLVYDLGYSFPSIDYEEYVFEFDASGQLTRHFSKRL